MSELNRRINLWKELTEIPKGKIPPDYLRKKHIYGGAQGIYLDKDKTSSLTSDNLGVTVSVLHTGDYYPDELSEDGLTYHYPKTARPSTRDRNEIEATKNSFRLGLPIFVILPGRPQTFREVRLGWVIDFDDQNEVFLIEFTEEKPVYVETEEESPFSLTEKKNTKLVKAKVRPGQRRFRYEVMKHYGYRCCVCSICHPKVLDAAHIRGKEESGSDDWRNGLVFCKTHHSAFDSGLFAINPETLELVFPSRKISDEINLPARKIETKTGRHPHKEALIWKWEKRGV